ncbi:LysM peptidoglycan-binding domain-containing protein [Sediminibacterium soli]|uniref:LysM peptidoglycan-binding domain-containing protein n=1 Tax=Sediminibacterium soli TaxID=2698829 RepID=UPI0013793CFB|nr:LysM peptidoglycan-binding domain-containing protein [Sediminibacterium soli]NCI47148.1 LysM peptidoglycan-binding domain-containing protein [Sediminibacterium soli]
MKCAFLLLACAVMLRVSAQEKLVIMGREPNRYVVHTVKSETSLQTVSNQFGQSVTKLAAYNRISPNKKLAKGTQVKIPLTQYNLVHAKTDRSSAPLFHKIAKGDNLYRLSKDSKVPLATLKQWNGLKADAVKIGDLVIVGYMVNAKTEETPEPAAPVTVREETKTTPVAGPKTTEETIVAKTEEKPAGRKEPVIAEKTPQENTVTAKPAAVNTAAASVSQTDNTGYTPREGDEGYFASAYAQPANDQNKQFHSGDAATFKTISGWSDHKYYVLINDVAPETIVRITAPNNKSICAKVLGPLQETKGGSGLLLRMSNSAASALGFTDPKFTVTVTYFE